MRLALFDRKRTSTLLLAIFMMLAIISTPVQAALIRGSIYDLALDKESDVIVEIDTVPKQLLVAKSGDYAFSVKPGNYSLYAHTSTSGSRESISITDDGNYTLDIVLEETFVDVVVPGYDDSDLNVSSGNLEFSGYRNSLWLWLIGALLTLLAAGIVLRYLIPRFRSHPRKAAKEHVPERSERSGLKSEPDDPYAAKVLQVIKKEKRTTQKDVRKEIPLSEAKISLIVADLEDKGKIRKIKKGRGNILIFVQD